MPIKQLRLLRLEIPDEWITDAKAMKEYVDSQKRESGFETQRFDAKTDYKGRIGERAFEWFLVNELGLDESSYEWMNGELDQRLPYDFVVHNGTRSFSIDVKSAGPQKYSFEECQKHIDRWEYLYPESSKPSEKDLVVLVYVWEANRTCCIVGFIEAQVVAECPIKTRAVDGPADKYAIPNRIIRPIKQLFRDIDEFSDFCGL